jgi:PAS domain-containing protein
MISALGTATKKHGTMKTMTKYLLANSLLAILGISVFALYSLNRFHKVQSIITLCGLLAFFATITFVLGRVTKKIEIMKEDHLCFLRTLIDTIPSPLFYKNAAGKYLGANRAFESFVGMARKELGILNRSAA